MAEDRTGEAVPLGGSALPVSGPGVLVAIDGPSGSGKSTAAKHLARLAQIDYLDTGAMYRALALSCLEAGVDLVDAAAVVAVAKKMDFRTGGTVDSPKFYLGTQDVTAALRAEEVVEIVSTVAAHPELREWMVQEQRSIMLQARSEGRGMVAEGRDVGTVVCPEADVRILLSADPEVRLRRRTQELYGKVTPELLDSTRQAVHDRDMRDSQVSNFTEPVQGVVQIDSTDLSLDEVVAQIMSIMGQVGDT